MLLWKTCTPWISNGTPLRGGPLDVEGGWRNKQKKNLHHEVLAKNKFAPWSLSKKKISPINSLTKKIFPPWLHSNKKKFSLATLGITPPSFECFGQKFVSTNMVWQKKNLHHNICGKKKISTSMVWPKFFSHYQCVAKKTFPPYPAWSPYIIGNQSHHNCVDNYPHLCMGIW